MATSLVTLAPQTIDYFRRALRARLGDTYWVDAELRLAVIEAVRVWNAAARYYRDRVVFQTLPGISFYDLSVEASSQLGYSITDRDLITEMEYQLLEPPTPSAWTGTDMFTLEQLAAALERRRNQFLGETGSRLTHYYPPISPPPIGRVFLQDTVIDIRRAAWGAITGSSPTWDESTQEWQLAGQTWDFDTSGFDFTTLWRDDEVSINAFAPRWNLTPGTPKVYSSSVTLPFRMQLAPPPSDLGVLDLLVVAAGAALDPILGGGIPVGVPEDFAWAVKYGALADLLGKEGPAQDTLRAAYCEQRYRDGVELARMATSGMQAEVNGVPVQLSTVFDLDTFSPSWQSSAPSTPTVVAFAGLNMVAVSPVPDGVHSITLDVVRNAPIPGDTATLNLTRDVADAIVDYAQHVATFKEAGAEFKDTMPQYERLMRLAAIHNEKLKANAQNFEILRDRSQLEFQQRTFRETVSA